MITRLSLALASLVLLVGCGGDPKVPAPTLAPPATTAPLTLAPTTEAPSATTGAPDPGPTITDPAPPDAPGFIRVLRAIDPRLVADPERAIRRGLSTCQEVSAAKPEATLVGNARARFGGSEVMLDEGDATRIVAAARTSLCPDAGSGR